MKHSQTFASLVGAIRQAHDSLSYQASKAINLSLTLRNWLIGYYIKEYELHGSDRALYGDRLFSELAQALQGLSNCNRRQLYRYLRFYNFYPEIVGTLPPQFKQLSEQSLLAIVGTASPLSSSSAQQLIYRLSYSHFDALVDIDDADKRQFYEQACMQGNWSVRELQRQINSLYYERSELSLDKTTLSALAHSDAETQSRFNIRDPYVFEFLGLKPAEVMSESHLPA